MAASKHQQAIPEARRQEIGRRLYEAREDLGITQAELAERMDCSEGTISRYESSGRIPNQRSLRLLSDALEKSIPYLRASDWSSNGKEGADGES